MSHFTTMVITHKGEDPEELLAPFVEEVESDSRYAEFDVEVKKEDFATKAKEIVAGLKKDDESLPKYKKLLEEEKYTEIFEDWFGGAQHHGNWGYWCNPNAKWDWYVLGGRWTGYLKPIKGATGELGESGVFDNKPNKGYFDQMLFKDIDWQGMIKDSLVKAEKWWKEAEKLNESDKSIRFDIGKDVSHDQYINRFKNVAPHAIITADGEWHESGRMGWWGMVSDKKDEDKWAEEVAQVLKECKPDDTISIYDLHI